MSYFQQFVHINQTLKSQGGMGVKFWFEDLEQFECSMCGDCCRSSFKILISKTYYDDYYQRFHQDESERFQAPFSVLKNPTEKRYAFLRRHDSGDCIFLDDDLHCSIQRRYGHEAIPEVCQKYPRFQTQLNSRSQTIQLLPSCQEAPALWLKPQTMKYSFYEVSDLPEQRYFRGFRMGLFSYHLWLGLCFDIFVYPSESPLFNLFHLHQAIKLLHGAPEQDISESYLEKIHLFLNHYFQSAPALLIHEATRLESLQYIIHYFRQLDMNAIAAYYQQIVERESDWPILTTEEKELLNTFTKHYLLHLTLIYQEHLKEQKNLMAEYLVLMLSAVLTQLAILYYRALNGGSLQESHIRDGGKLIGIVFQHLPFPQMQSLTYEQGLDQVQKLVQLAQF